MRTYMSSIVAAAIAVGSVQFASAQNTATDNQVQNAANRAADDTNRAVDKTGSTMDRAADRTGNAAERAADRTGDAAERAADRTGNALDRTADRAGSVLDDAQARLVRDALADSANAALTKGGFDDLVERFVDADRNRIGSIDDDQLTTLHGRVDQIQKAWDEKYDDKFAVEERAFEDRFARIYTGEIRDPDDDARTAGQTVPPAKGVPNPNQPQIGREGTPSDPGGVAAGERAVGTTPDGGTNTTADANREPGRNIATVVIPASHGLPELRIPMLQEFPGTWKIDVPDKVDQAKLRQNLLDHLTHVGEHTAQWPATKEEAYRFVSHHVLMAVLDMPVQKAGQQQQQQQQQPPASN